VGFQDEGGNWDKSCSMLHAYEVEYVQCSYNLPWEAL